MEEQDKLGDEMAQFETLKSVISMKSKKMDLKMRLVYKKRLYLETVNWEQMDKPSLDLHFFQAAEDIRTGRLPTTREVILKLAGLKAQSDLGDMGVEPLTPPQQYASSNNE